MRRNFPRSPEKHMHDLYIGRDRHFNKIKG